MYIKIDRRETIRKAIFNSKENSVIVISGRGNRRKFIINNKEYLFSDEEIVKNVINNLGWR